MTGSQSRSSASAEAGQASQKWVISTLPSSADGAVLTAEATPGSHPSISAWCNSTGKRWMDVIGAIFLLALSLPFLFLVAVCVLISSRGPVLFVQERVGRHGRMFKILKFRTLRHGSETGPSLTSTSDPRQTRVGRWLRDSKLDELPQLWNVLRGDMSLVGPRPHLPQLWDAGAHGAAEVLSVRPGLTSAAALEGYREHELLETVEENESIELYYLAEILPEKIRRNLDYTATASFRTDLSLLTGTLCFSVLHLFSVLRRVLRSGSNTAQRSTTRQ